MIALIVLISFLDALRENYLFTPEVANDVVILKACAAWFYNARDRGGGRGRRKKIAERKKSRQSRL